MDGHKSERNASVAISFALLIVITCLLWKPILTVVWRLRNSTTTSLGNRVLVIPWPWLLTKSGDSVKLRAFETQWPTVNNGYATALLSVSRSSDAGLSDSDWFLQSKSSYENHGFGDVKEVSFTAKGVLCAEAMSGKIESDYCRLKQGYNLTFIGPHTLLVRLVDNLLADN